MDINVAAERMALDPTTLSEAEIDLLFRSPHTASALAVLAPDALASLLAKQAGLDGGAVSMFRKIIELDCSYHKGRLKNVNSLRGPFAEYVGHRLNTARKSGILFDQVLREAMPANREAFLEIGAGLGFGMLHSRRCGFKQAHGVEIDAVYAQVGVEAFQGRPDLRYDVADYLEWKAPTKYDLIFCIDVLEHVQDIEACLRRIEEDLSPQGMAIVRFTVPTMVGVALNEPHYKRPLLALCTDAGAQSALELGLIRTKQQYVVNRWPNANDIDAWSRANGLHVYCNIENIDCDNAAMFYTAPMWRQRLAQLDAAAQRHQIYENIAREPQVIAWRERVEMQLAEIEAGRPILFRDAMELFGSYWTLIVSREPIDASNLVPFVWMTDESRILVDGDSGAWERVQDKSSWAPKSVRAMLAPIMGR